MSNLSTKLAGGTVLSKPQLPDLSKRLFEYTGAEFLQLLQDSQPTPQIPSIENPSKLKRFVSDEEARKRLSGNPGKPLSKPTFNKLRKEGKIQTFFPSPGRVAFDLDDLDNYIATTQGKANSILTKNKNR